VILLIDNYDSFTWNLVQRLGELDPTLDPADQLDSGRGPSHVIISPGPCSPNEAGASSAIIERFAGRVPVLGVCLGHQCIGAMNGMTVTRHVIPMHGKTSPVQHDGTGVYAGLSNPFTATRYHSLVVLAETVPVFKPGQDGWTVSAWTDEDDGKGGTRRVVMGLRRVWTDSKKSPVEGVQFHPESFLTEEGPKLLANFLRMGPRPRSVHEAVAGAR
jgi:anthranilate synthase/aminodeoxychorismate synthase-like glutamine amidotransferase